MEACTTLFDAPVIRTTLLSYPGTREGRITEALALARLLELGHQVATPAVDDGDDLLIYRGGHYLTAQIKGKSPTWHHGGKRYLFRAKRGWNSDLYLLRPLDDDFWWVVPGTRIRALGDRQTITFHRGSGTYKRYHQSPWEACIDRWDTIEDLFNA